MINVPKWRDGRAYFLKEMERFIALSELIPKSPVSSCSTLNLKNSSIPVLQTNGRGNILKRLLRSSPAYEIKLRYFFPICKGKHQYCWSKGKKPKNNKNPNPYPICLPAQFCRFLLTFGVLVATACGEAAWPAWLDREVDLLGEAPLEEGRDLRPLGRKAAMLWLAPSAKMNFSRSSTFVLPLAAAKKGVHLIRYKMCHKAVYCHFCHANFNTF